MGFTRKSGVFCVVFGCRPNDTSHQHSSAKQQATGVANIANPNQRQHKPPHYPPHSVREFNPPVIRFNRWTLLRPQVPTNKLAPGFCRVRPRRHLTWDPILLGEWAPGVGGIWNSRLYTTTPSPKINKQTNSDACRNGSVECDVGLQFMTQNSCWRTCNKFPPCANKRVPAGLTSDKIPLPVQRMETQWRTAYKLPRFHWLN